MNHRNHHNFSISHLVKLLLIIFIIGLTSCGGRSHYLYTESELSLRDSIQEPQIIKTKAYKLLNGKAQTVGVIAPDSCRKQSAMSSSTHQSDFIRSQCGVQVGIIEKGLLKKGYDVVSWKIIQKMPAETSVRDIGKELGIDVFFSINSLENINADSSNVSFKRAFYRSDKSGKKGKLWNIGEPHRSLIKEQLETLGDSTMSFGAVIDVTAIEVKTGKAIWYYQASFYNVKDEEHKLTTLFHGKKANWKIVQINGEPITHHTNDDNGATEQGSKSANIGDDIYLKYLKMAVSSFITSFRSNN